jgi:hypothetical protein
MILPRPRASTSWDLVINEPSPYYTWRHCLHPGWIPARTCAARRGIMASGSAVFDSGIKPQNSKRVRPIADVHLIL